MKSAQTLSVVDLVVLGLLMDEPMNAYRLSQLVSERQLGRLVKISTPAIYKSCRRLSEAGFLMGKVVRESEAPEKVVYTVNKNGKKHFQELMAHFSQNLSPFHFEFNSFIWNLYRLDHAEGLRMLKTLQSELQTMQKWLSAHEKEDVARATFGIRMVVKQYRMVVTALVQWIGETIEEFCLSKTKEEHKRYSGGSK